MSAQGRKMFGLFYPISKYKATKIQLDILFSCFGLALCIVGLAKNIQLLSLRKEKEHLTTI